MTSALRAFFTQIFREFLPPSLAHNAPDMRFSTTEKTWLASESRYLFFTENGPVEVGFRPQHSLKIVGGLTAGLLFAIYTAPFFYSQTMQIIPSVIQALSSTAQNQQPASHEAPLTAGNDLPTDKLADILAPLIQPITEKPLPADTSVFVPSPAVPKMLQEDEAVTSLPEERPENYVTEMVLGNEAVTSLPEERPENYVTEMVLGNEAVTSLPEERPENYVTARATQIGSAPVTPTKDEPIAPLPRPKPEPMDPEFVGLDSLAKAPFLDERTKLHRLFADYLSQARQIETIADRFDIRLDSRPNSWPIDAEPDEGLVANLLLYRDRWVKILNQIPLKSPLRYYYITSPYGMRTNKKTGVTRFHHGVDLASTWNAELRPPASGIVSFAGRNGSFGNVVRVRHAHNIETVYAHLSSINVATGDFVTEDIELGKVGNTGRSDGMHLHYEILINDKSINPALFFKIGHQLSNTGGIPREIQF